jgi:Cdc6-like AAA superfamily ATPase
MLPSNRFLKGLNPSTLLDFLPSPLPPRNPARPLFRQIEQPSLPDPPEVARIGRKSAIHVSLADRWVALGMTGSGKTTWARELLSRLRSSYPAARLYVLDSKQMNDFSALPGYFIRDQVAPDPIRQPGAVQIWQPPLDDVAQYSDWFTKILKARQPAVVLIDELSSLGGQSGRQFPLGYMLLAKQGRGLDISMVSLTQEAAYIPRVTLGQTSHLLRFRLLNEHDQRVADKVLGRQEKGEPPHQHGFYYRRLDRAGDVFLYRGHQEFFNE